MAARDSAENTLLGAFLHLILLAWDGEDLCNQRKARRDKGDEFLPGQPVLVAAPSVISFAASPRGFWSPRAVRVSLEQGGTISGKLDFKTD